MCWRPQTATPPRSRTFCGPRMALVMHRGSPSWLSKIEKGHSSSRRVTFTNPLEFWICSGEPRGTRTLNPLIKSLLVDGLSVSANIHGCLIFPGFGSSPVCQNVLKCAAIYPVGCQFGCQTPMIRAASGRRLMRTLHEAGCCAPWHHCTISGKQTLLMRHVPLRRWNPEFTKRPSSKVRKTHLSRESSGRSGTTLTARPRRTWKCSSVSVSRSEPSVMSLSVSALLTRWVALRRFMLTRLWLVGCCLPFERDLHLVEVSMSVRRVWIASIWPRHA
jgi:hypothetical protein